MPAPNKNKTPAWGLRKAKRRNVHLSNVARNQRILHECGVDFRYLSQGDAYAMLFEAEGKPRATFYASTGVWHCSGKTHRGGARAFVRWWQSAGDQVP